MSVPSTFQLALTALVRAAIAMGQKRPDEAPGVIEMELEPSVELIIRAVGEEAGVHFQPLAGGARRSFKGELHGTFVRGPTDGR